MSILRWNCRGAAATATVRELRSLVSKHKSAAIFLMETKSRREKLEEIKTKLHYHDLYVVNPRGLSGGLAHVEKRP